MLPWWSSMLTVFQSLSLQFATQCILSSSITKEQGNGQSYIEQDVLVKVDNSASKMHWSRATHSNGIYPPQKSKQVEAFQDRNTGK